ncbi:uncharacterized protein LOC126724986 [Quercus robur]|uniref:uncharacterized protein LOC126724986 n=1 Tax=Quercus robur TaxID=38942 RepID=UPI002162B383|nr:uncharacterized protein LOC126724986 [Quercus robur]
MWTPPCQLHLKPPTERLYRLSRYRLRTLSRWRLCGDRDARVRMLPIAGPVMVRLDLSGHMGGNEKIIKCLSVCLYFLPIGDCIVTGISMQNVLLIGENLGGCASISGSLLGENTGCQCVCCQEIDILEKTHKAYCIY